jgi:hypothetical protein
MITAKKLRQKARLMESDANYKFIIAKLEKCDATAYELEIPLASLPENYFDGDIDRYCYRLANLGFIVTVRLNTEMSARTMLVSWRV